ncbi:MAG: hypothetical protein HUJ88_11070 [Fusobacterium necrophorum]|nr:hypothetical protein [Fusobacterium necrophorum]
MKKQMIGCLLFFGSLIAYGEIDLSQGNMEEMWGYHGIEISGYYEKFYQEEKELGALMDLYAKERAERYYLANLLENDNRDRDNLFQMTYLGFSSKSYSSNDIGVAFGVSKDEASRLGLQVIGGKGKRKEQKENIKTNKIGLQGFYFQEKGGLQFLMIPFVSFSQWKAKEKSKVISFGGYTKLEKDVFPEWISFDYVVPSVVWDAHYQQTRIKEEETVQNESLTSSIAFQGKHETYIGNVKVKSHVKVGYEYEALKKTIYKSENKKDPNPHHAIGELQIGLEWKETFLLSTQAKIQKSLTKDSMSSNIGIGVSIRF